MKIPFQRWKEAIQVRHSTRTYNNQPLSNEVREDLEQFIKSASSTVEGVRAVLVEDGGDKVVRFIMGSYGVIKGIRSYIAFVADKQSKNYYEKMGYLGEMCVLEATALKLGTCWISGTFDPQIVGEQINLKPSEEVIAITPVGYPAENKSLVEKLMKKVVGSHKRKPLEELCPEGYNTDWPEWIKEALELARIAPSAANKQPWRFIVSENNREIKITVEDTGNLDRKRLDCGIAMLHIEIGALANGNPGKWKYLNKPDIAIYKIN